MLIKRLLILIFCLCIVGSASAIEIIIVQPAGKATPTYDTDGSNTSSGSDTCTVAIDPTDSLSNPIVIVSIGWEDSTDQATISALTYDGGDITGNLIDTQTNDDGSEYDAVAMYYILDATLADTSKNIVVTMNEAVTGISIGWIVYYNVKQQAPEASAKASGSNATPSVSVTSITNGALVTDVVLNRDSTKANVATGDNTGAEVWTASAGQTTTTSAIIDAVAGGNTMSWLIGASDSRTWVIIGAAFEAADL